MKPSLLERGLAKLHKLFDNPWYIPLLAFLAGADAFIYVIPIEALLISRVLLRPKGWWLGPLCVALGSALGALLLAVLIQTGYGLSYKIGALSPSPSPDWQRASDYVQAHGALGLALVSLSFIPQQPAVMIAALAKMPYLRIFFAVGIARAVKYSALGAVAAFAPHWLTRFAFVRRTLEKLKGKSEVSPGG